VETRATLNGGIIPSVLSMKRVFGGFRGIVQLLLILSVIL